MILKKDSHPSKFYWELRVRRGSQKAVAAVARRMSAAIYFMLKNNLAYSEEYYEEAKQKYKESRKRKLREFLDLSQISAIPYRLSYFLSLGLLKVTQVGEGGFCFHNQQLFTVSADKFNYFHAVAKFRVLRRFFNVKYIV
ncbi:MAG: hypothetical protein LBU32_17730 [Clostridiales bacterium]|jgi:hypothetical protein|nr:hypothetical protein [Clostridiales bacterium]